MLLPLVLLLTRRNSSVLMVTTIRIQLVVSFKHWRNADYHVTDITRISPIDFLYQRSRTYFALFTTLIWPCQNGVY